MKHLIKAHMYHCHLHSLPYGTSLNTTRQTRLVLSLKLHLSTCIFCALYLHCNTFRMARWGGEFVQYPNRSFLVWIRFVDHCFLSWNEGFSPFKDHIEKKLYTLQAGDNLLLRSVFDEAKGEIWSSKKLQFWLIPSFLLRELIFCSLTPQTLQHGRTVFCLH